MFYIHLIMIFFLYVPILLSLSLSFVIHVFKKHIHLFLLDLVTTFYTTNTSDNYKLHPNSSTTTVHMQVLDSPPPPKHIGFIEDVDERIKGLMTCTKSFGFQSIGINNEINDNDNNNDEDDDDCWRRTTVAEGRGNFPPPLSSLNGNGQPSFILVPIRKNGRLLLNKVRMKRPKVLNATRQDGRLRLFLVPDQCVEDNAEEEEEELVDDIEEQMKEEEVMIVELMEEEEKDDEMVEEITNYEQKYVRIGEWKFSNERIRKCHEILNHIQGHHHVNGSHHHLHMYGFSIA